MLYLIILPHTTNHITYHVNKTTMSMVSMVDFQDGAWNCDGPKKKNQFQSFKFAKLRMKFLTTNMIVSIG